VLQSTAAIYISPYNVSRTYIIRKQLLSERETKFLCVCVCVHALAYVCMTVGFTWKPSVAKKIKSILDL